MSPAGPARIHVLPSALANQIAAGEVVERPASVLKELVENSLDAGATRIEVEAEGAGIGLLRVRDNGHGIHAADLALALERHATSKIAAAADLDAIRSLGFRGEALPSIAAVARLRLCSRTAAAESGAVIDCDPLNGRRQQSPLAHPVGTTVEVRGLFAGVPARRRFLRSTRTEYLHLLDAARRLALCPQAGGFSFSHDGQRVFRSAGGAGSDRIGEVLGRAFLRDTLALDARDRGTRLYGRIGRPGVHRSQSDQQYLYLNGRIIRDRAISHAIRLACGDAVPAGRFPVYLLYLEMDAATVDVNVHPTKQEVRFHTARDLHDFVYGAVRAALGAQVQVGGGDLREPAIRYDAVAVPPAGALGRPLAQLGGRYLLCERDGCWLLVDARALLQDRVRTELARSRRERMPLPARPILVPLRLPLPVRLAEAAERHAVLQQQYGLDLTRSGPEQVAVRAIPAVLDGADAMTLARRVLELLARGDATALPERLAELLPELVAEQPCAGADPAQLSALLRTALTPDCDARASVNPGRWRTLDAAELARLLGGHAGRG